MPPHFSSQPPDNPLLPLVLRLLRETPTGISEHELLKKIEAAGGVIAQAVDDDRLALFRKHFLLMNALYRLQEQLWRDERMWLQISPLRIALLERIDAAPSGESALGEAAGDAALREYYLDWRELQNTDSAAVAELLDGFWRRYHAADGRAEALAVLQLDAAADWAQVKRQYRRLAGLAHPDRGGDGAAFLAIREAYETLRIALRES